jgi:hypothetical protein
MLPLKRFHWLDPVTNREVLAQSHGELLRRILIDCQRSQTKAHLVRLTVDPNFNEDVLRARIRARLEAESLAQGAYAEELRLRAAEQERVGREIENARRDETVVRTSRAARYKAEGVDLGSGRVTLEEAGRLLGIPKPTITRWARMGLSIEQMKYLALAPQRGKSIDERLEDGGMIAGVPGKGSG